MPNNNINYSHTGLVFLGPSLAYKSNKLYTYYLPACPMVLYDHILIIQVFTQTPKLDIFLRLIPSHNT